MPEALQVPLALSSFSTEKLSSAGAFQAKPEGAR
jgi:hypothetical protein